MCELGCWACADRDLFVVVVQLYRIHIYPADCELADIHVFLSFVHVRTVTDAGKNSLQRDLTTIVCIATCVICLYDLTLRADTILFTAGHISHALSTHVSSQSPQLFQKRSGDD